MFRLYMYNTYTVYIYIYTYMYHTYISQEMPMGQQKSRSPPACQSCIGRWITLSFSGEKWCLTKGKWSWRKILKRPKCPYNVSPYLPPLKKPASHHGYEGWEALMETFNLPWWSLLQSGPSSMSWKITQFLSPMLTPLPMSGHWLLLPYSLRAKLRLSRLCSALMNSCCTCQKPRSLKLKSDPELIGSCIPRFWSWSLQTKKSIQKSICWVGSSS